MQTIQTNNLQVNDIFIKSTGWIDDYSNWWLEQKQKQKITFEYGLRGEYILYENKLYEIQNRLPKYFFELSTKKSFDVDFSTMKIKYKNELFNFEKQINLKYIGNYQVIGDKKTDIVDVLPNPNSINKSIKSNMLKDVSLKASLDNNKIILTIDDKYEYTADYNIRCGDNVKLTPLGLLSILHLPETEITFYEYYNSPKKEVRINFLQDVKLNSYGYCVIIIMKNIEIFNLH